MTASIHDVYAAAREYVMPDVEIEACEIGLLFGTQHGLDEFVSDTIALWHEHRFAKLIVSGGATTGPGEAEATTLQRRLVDAGLPQELITLECAATNTAENVVLSRKIARECGIETATSVLGIGKLCSLRRYYMTLARHWPEATRVCVHGVNYFGVRRDDWWQEEEFRKRVFAELAKVHTYIEKGDILEVDL